MPDTRAAPTTRDGLLANLRAVFDGEDPVLFTDDHDLAGWLNGLDIEATVLDSRSAERLSGPLPPRVVVVPLEYGRLPSRRALRDLLSNSSALWFPFASFSPDFDTAAYALELFAASDVTRAVALNRRLLTRLLLARDAITLSGPDTELTARLPDVLHASSRTRLGMLPDEHSTLGNYFEVALSPTDLSGRVDDSFTISGTLRIDSVLAAKHRELAGPRAGYFPAATELAAEMRKACPLYFTIRDNRIVDGLGIWAKAIEEMSGPQYRGALTEFAFGTSGLPPEKVDWNLNCLLNESVSGIHVAVGDSISGIHFDFIATEAELNGV
ncbi:hypothetical protein OK074_5550 [Actinobacteria bacterium OK074]|nr:hypothetical protein OK074_5550 [Actinobacteria bacterium OK074]